MSGSVNKVILIGNLGADPEIRSLTSGDRVANLRIATSETWKDSRGERQERTEWHRVTIFNDALVKVVENFARKGTKLYIEGKLQTRKWTDQGGVERYSTEIVLQKFGASLLLLSGKDDGERGSGEQYSGGGRQDLSDRPREDFTADLDDEIPF